MDAGIYVIVALAHDCPICAITRDPAPNCYPPQLKEQAQHIIKEFSRYPNTLAFSAGNEVNHFAPLNNPQFNAPCQKKFIQDMRDYIDSCPTIRRIPVGLVSADDQRDLLAYYYNCPEAKDNDIEFTGMIEGKLGLRASSLGNFQSSNDGTAEWYGLNSYLSCDGNARTIVEAPGMVQLRDSFLSYNYSIPVLLTEFGCLSETFPTVDGFEGQRTFNQAQWIFEDAGMRDAFAGGFAFEYSVEYENAFAESPYPFQTFGKQNYGIGYFTPQLCDDVQVNCTYTPMPSYYMLKNAYTNTTVVQITNRKDYTIPENRRLKSHCPEEFPSLISFDWSATNMFPNVGCPHSGPASSFACPAPSTQSKSQEYNQTPFRGNTTRSNVTENTTLESTSRDASIQMSATCKRCTHRIKHGVQPSNASEFMACFLVLLFCCWWLYDASQPVFAEGNRMRYAISLSPKSPIVVIAMKATTTRAFHLPSQAAYYRCTTTPLRMKCFNQIIPLDQAITL
jgi:1,3-beta-glucanosyltransferase GAS5